MNLYPLCYANDNDALIPELWAEESLAILEENMVMANLVHRDFSPLVASYGDVINTRRPGEFSTKRKSQGDSVVNQDAQSTNVQVPLDQHVYVSFTIKDEEASLSFKELISFHLEPAAMQMARTVDRILCGQVHEFKANASGRLAEMSSSNAKDWILEAREIMEINKAYPNGRNLLISPQAETQMLKTELFIAANQRGDGGTALEEAKLGRVLGFDTFMDQNVNYVALANADTLTLNHVPGAAIGATGNLAITASSAVTVGSYAWFTGEGQPKEISALTGTTTGITLVEAYKYAVSANAVGYAFEPAVVGATYAAGYDKGITLNTIAANKLVVVGQILAFGTTAGGDRKEYTVIETDSVNTTSVIVWLDRPLEVALTAADSAFPGPHGSWCFAFHRDALAFVNRPLALPSSTLGVQAAVGSYNNLAMRVAMQYDISSQGTIVTLDMLCGVATLDTKLGCVLYA
jgi:hypothetical protein